MNIFPGQLAFRLKDEKGMPLSMVIQNCLATNRIIEWPSFIEAARTAGWYDFQTLAQLRAALSDADAGADYTDGVIQRFKLYVVKFPHPCLKEKK
jgi:hypothetical protein